MDLFDMFVIPDPEPETTQEPPVDLVNELDMIIQKHGFKLPKDALSDLASYYLDPPPWAPWVK
ncbi:hypothetical protein QL01_20 [Escherichia phage QL01]|uniref:Molybdenum ABC transporter n=1 Tax=Escherichia phage QL01 TaxID=1673871 RepID=A0A0K1LJI4_9CAUD|nr:hypothetical protein AVT32_gp020 [Escherichia phage QL01]AKU42677.1 hypothetical protein QL01_20 [Escherichia phage QL01]QXV72378.1 hypothetical protein PSD9_93 [Shigella phage PSD9]